MVGERHPLARLEPAYILAHLDDFAGDLVAQHLRASPTAVPLHDVAAADARCLDADQQLPRADLGKRQLLQPDVVIVVVHGHAHGPSSACGRRKYHP